MRIFIYENSKYGLLLFLKKIKRKIINNYWSVEFGFLQSSLSSSKRDTLSLVSLDKISSLSSNKGDKQYSFLRLYLIKLVKKLNKS